ncbi:hypothetical protein [uncultured Aquimarina sp.]|uniref:hypothetical protein n=1 Tax=uncultured Aquimarina sp. TaxID=575652 RepID=UPI0026264A63|nr:hypothetical protein [uncultured Aquimarina sp.]
MKTKLLYLTSFLLVFITSCSSDESINGSVEQEKDLKVKSLIEAFAKDVIPSPGFSKFIEEVQNKSSSGLTTEEAAQLEQEFLSRQTEEFVELYYYVLALDLSKEELRGFIIEYLSIINKSFKENTKNDTDECAAGGAGDDDSILWALILAIFCEENKV